MMDNKEEQENTAGTAHEDWCHGILYLQGKNHNTQDYSTLHDRSST